MMTTTNPNAAFKTTDNTHRHNHTILHHIGRRLLLLTTLLAMAVGVKAQLADGVYTLDNVNGRGALSYGTYDDIEYFGLSEVTLNGYQSCSVTLSNDKDKYWYVATLNGVTYLYNIGKGTFVQKRQDETVTCAAYSNGGFTLESRNGNYSIKDGSHYLSYCCYWLPNAQLRWLSSYEEAAALIDFNLVENGTTTYAKEIAAARAKLGFPTEDKYYIKCYTDQSLYLKPTTNNNNSYITVSKTKNDDLLWQLEYVGDGKYRIKHVSTGRYIYRNGTPGYNQSVQMSNTSNNDRNYFYFEVNANYPNAYAIEPVDCNGYSFNIWGGRVEGNTIGLYDHPDNGHSMWILERRKTPTPEITLGDEGYVTITCSQDGATSYYTINGDAPTTDSPQYDASNKPQVKDGDLVQAISVYADYDESDVASFVANMTIPVPGITIDDSGQTSITVAMQNCTIYYTTNGEEPTESSAIYTAPFNVTNKTIVKAIAVRSHYKTSSVASCYYVTDMAALPGAGTEASPFEISTMEQWIAFAKTVNSNSTKDYHARLTADISGYNITIKDFSGTLDGQYHTFSGLNAPLFATASNATIKNIMMDNVSISAPENAGAIASTASGTTRIYNCGILATSESSIYGNDNVGSIVGELQGSARVINCYSFANVTGGSKAAGIVGNITGTVATAATATSSGAMVMNCAYYGIPSNADVYPIYGGNEILNNRGVNTYNFYRLNAGFTKNLDYGCASAITDDSYLDRFEFYRRILNSHRELAALYCFGNAAQYGEIGKWVLDKNVADYPYVQQWATGTQKTLGRTIPNTPENYAGKQVGRVEATIIINGNSYYETLPITDMDTARWDYTYGKVMLPFANEFTGWTPETKNSEYLDRIITGWEITSMTGGTQGKFTTTGDNRYNFADPKCMAKDLYASADNEWYTYVYAQGGNLVIPEGVTAITITAHWADAVYLRDAYYDLSYNNEYYNQQNIGAEITGKYNGKTVCTSLSEALTKFDVNKELKPFDQAIVLVGNYHYNQRMLSDNATVSGFNYDMTYTIMSIDNDKDQEPDYCWYSYHTIDRTGIGPHRFDFIANVGIGMAARVKGSTAVPTIGIWHCRGWSEYTETYLGIMTECEIHSGAFDAYYGQKSPWIANGGIFKQIIHCKGIDGTNLAYIRIGGNAYIDQLHPGSHDGDNNTTTLSPINVCGGEIKECYLTGRKSTASTTGDALFWCNGGYIHNFLGAYMEPVNGNVIAKIDHALVDNFYGGGANSNQPVTGNINISINNSLVDFFCGGPKVGDMSESTSVSIIAKGTTFGQFYGGGYGGTALTRKRTSESSIDFSTDKTFPITFADYTTRRLKKDGDGLGSGYVFEYFLFSGGRGTGVARFYVDYASLSLATVQKVTVSLNECNILNDYYGGGCQGRVTGDITSTLTDCNILGNAFAGGYTAAATPIAVYTTEQPTYAKYIKASGSFTPFGTTTPETYTWKQATDGHAAGSVDSGNKYIYTDVDMTKMGEVNGNTEITVSGNSYVGGAVYGGGNESRVKGTTTVHINATDGGNRINNVFGGANQADVDGATTVNINSGNIGNVFGANNKSGTKGSTIEVNVKGATSDYVYGAGNLAAYTGSPVVNMSAGTVKNALYGGGLGETAVVTGNPQVNMTGGTVGYTEKVDGKDVVRGGDVFGGGNAAAVEGNTNVSIAAGEVKRNVYGGGNQANVSGTTNVVIGQ